MFRLFHLLAISPALFLFLGCSQSDQPDDGASQAQTQPNSPNGTSKPEHDPPIHNAPPTSQNNNQPDSAQTPGRNLTEWVLKKGGSVSAYVGDKQMSWEGEAKLPDGEIEPFRIRLEGVTISDDEMSKLTGQMRLRDLYLNQSTVTDDGLKQLRDLPKLEALQLVGTQVTDQGIKHLAQIPSVQGLYLSSTEVGDVGVETISKLPSITVLWLADTKVTDAGLVHVGKIKTLYVLNLQQTAITDAGLTQLSQLSSLNHCDLRNTSVTAEAAQALDEQLPNGQVAYE